MADDQGPWAFGAAGDTRAHTPNMDRLAREGARFTNAFSPTPVCSPARAGILTSRYGSELGITDWINPAVDKGVGLDDAIPTWPRLLQRAGYATALFGKWHVGDLDAQWLLTPAARPPGTPNIPAGQRPNLFDTSLKVPMLIRWPGTIKPGTVNPHTLSHLDWLPTFAALAGATIPPGTVIRGRDAGPLLRGEARNWNDDFHAEYSMKHGAKVHLRTLRTPEWKLIRDFNNEGRDELYHLAADPGETRNRIDDPDPKIRRIIDGLDQRLRAKMTELGDPALPAARARPAP